MDTGNQTQEEVIGIPVQPSFRAERSSRPPIRRSTLTRKDSMVDRLSKLRNKADNFVHGVRDHVSVGHKISETVKGKLSLGARILKTGGFEGVFKKTFSAGEDEKLLKTSQCYLSTTAGPVAGLLFVSTERIAFISERVIKLSSPVGSSAKVPYKVLVPLKKVKGVFTSENTEKPGQKYIYIVTVDGFEFWFMGFVNYNKAYKYLQKAVSQRHLCTLRHLAAHRRAEANGQNNNQHNVVNAANGCRGVRAADDNVGSVMVDKGGVWQLHLLCMAIK